MEERNFELNSEYNDIEILDDYESELEINLYFECNNK